MPPKKKLIPPPKPKGMSSKTETKIKGKVVDDKTFGLKNKNRSTKVQEHIRQVTHQVMDGDQKGGRRAQENALHEEKAKKQKANAAKALLASLFKGVVQVQTDADGIVDKKNSLCAYFKAGVCEKGKKCKYSHDLSLEDNRTIAIDLYSDPRTKTGKAPDTIITCRDFIEAVEKELYGFKWVCPNNGDNCTYRHMLPQGYVLNRDKGDQDSSDDDEMTLEEKIEAERALLVQEECTPVTLESFTKWKADRAQRKLDEIEAKIANEEARGRKDKAQMQFMSGRALFQYNPDMFDGCDDDDAADDTIFDDDFDGFGNQEESKGAAANQDGASDDDNDNTEEQKAPQGGKEEVKVDNALFAEDAAMEEEVDFD